MYGKGYHQVDLVIIKLIVNSFVARHAMFYQSQKYGELLKLKVGTFLIFPETGKIIPAKFGTWRKSKLYDPYMDIRKNLFEHYEGLKHTDRPQP